MRKKNVLAFERHISVAASALGWIAIALTAVASYFARKVVATPPIEPEDAHILGAIGDEITFRRDAGSMRSGIYGLTFSGPAPGKAVVGKVLREDPEAGVVVRVLQKVYSGDVRQASLGRWSGSVYRNPGDQGLPWREVTVSTPVGPAPAWYVPAETSTEPGAKTWVIIVHGRGASRAEGLPGVPIYRRFGMDSLLISYRNDRIGPVADNGKVYLGLTEWEDVVAAADFARAHGAERVLLAGYSMGGALALQAYARMPGAGSRPVGLLLDGPALDWQNILDQQVRLNKLPLWLGRYAQWIVRTPGVCRLAGLKMPIDFTQLDGVARAHEVRVPTLVIHSKDDIFVPYAPSAAFAQANPQFVKLVTFTGADHTYEWNLDPQRWEDSVRSWLHTPG